MLFNAPTNPATARARKTAAVAPAAQQRGVNEMGAIWDKHMGNTGLSETDRMVLIAADHAADQNTISELRDNLAEAQNFIAALQEQLAECQGNQITDTDDLIAALAVIEAEIDAERGGPITVEEELARR